MPYGRKPRVRLKHLRLLIFRVIDHLYGNAPRRRYSGHWPQSNCYLGKTLGTLIDIFEFELRFINQFLGELDAGLFVGVPFSEERVVRCTDIQGACKQCQVTDSRNILRMVRFRLVAKVLDPVAPLFLRPLGFNFLRHDVLNMNISCPKYL